MAGEEETEAMATQFSSSDVVDDRFSELPEHIIHSILSFLPNIKDVVRTSAISKSYLQAWSTFPIPVFDSQDFVSGGEDFEGKSEQNFIGFVNSYLQRFRRQNGGMKIFKLRTSTIKMYDHITRWVGMALENKVEHLALALGISMDGTPTPCLIPKSVLSANWLKSLRLDGTNIYIPPNEISRVDLPLLTCLTVACSDISDEQLHKLLSGCPALENIQLFWCDSLSKVDIFNQRNLETLNVMGIHRLTAVSVRAAKLKSFSYTCYGGVSNNVVEIHNSPELKSLAITDGKKTDEWLNKFIAKFPLLEDLRIENCVELRKIRISHPLLQKIIIANSYNLEDVVISCKKLASFFLSATPSSMLHTSIQMEMDNPPSDCTANIFVPALFKLHLMMKASWYSKLKEFLTRHFMFKRLTITVQALSALDGDMKGKHVHKKLPRAACTIENLRLNVSAHSSCHSHILNGLLSACHPTAIQLDAKSNNPFGKKNIPFIQLVCKELRNKGNKRNCFCKGDFKCWKHQLKEVKIEKITGIELQENLDWDFLFGLLPTLEAGNDIYFKLKW